MISLCYGIGVINKGGRMKFLVELKGVEKPEDVCCGEVTEVTAKIEELLWSEFDQADEVIVTEVE